tara:strand:- start:40 stop:420 length:381 start_codon:yes stop_codon:yes gene_type:complete
MFNKLKYLILDNLPTLFAILVVAFGLILITKHANAAEWNDKPVMCMQPGEFEDVLAEKNHVLILQGTQFAKVRSEEGLSDIPVEIPLLVYADLQSQNFVVVEYHPSYTSYCILAFGKDLDISGKRS